MGGSGSTCGSSGAGCNNLSISEAVRLPCPTSTKGAHDQADHLLEKPVGIERTDDEVALSTELCLLQVALWVVVIGRGGFEGGKSWFPIRQAAASFMAARSAAARASRRVRGRRRAFPTIQQMVFVQLPFRG